jgi:NAD(P)-dependent dehydrogenase (short-subunit alcohol dehydrogenase family)
MNTNQTILITGCSSGFGQATAALFLERGWNVIASMRTPRTDLFPPGERLRVDRLDVTDGQSVADAIARGIAHFGRIDAVVNNAGIGMFGAHEAVTDNVIREVFATNTFGVMAVNRAIAPHLRERGSGTIINVTSSVGIAPMPLVAAYTASKYAIEGFSESFAYEMGCFGVRVKVVQPGLAPTTRFATNSGGRCDAALPSDYLDYAGRYLKSMQDYPTAYTQASDVAEAVYAAATDGRDQLRYPAGADSVMLTVLRQSLSEPAFRERVRAMTGGAV